MSTYSSTKPTETQLRELRAIPGVRNVTVGVVDTNPMRDGAIDHADKTEGVFHLATPRRSRDCIAAIHTPLPTWVDIVA
jgi:hypothetical protein